MIQVFNQNGSWLYDLQVMWFTIGRVAIIAGASIAILNIAVFRWRTR